MRSKRMKLLTIVGIVSAIAFVLVATIKIPVVLFLKYEPKDVAIALTGLSVGPISAVLISIIVSLLEMVTISSTGFIGFVMNVLASLAFVLPASIIYHKNRTRIGAVIGLSSGVVIMTAVMLLWNYVATPIFMNMPRENVVPLLWSAILPFNLLKGGLNAAIIYLLYKPITTALKRYNGVETNGSKNANANSDSKFKLSAPLTVLAIFVIITCVMIILSFQGVI